MKFCRKFCPLVVMLSAAGHADDQAAPEAQLRWHNREVISGELVEASATDVKWKSPLFETALELDWEAVRSIDCPPAAIPTLEPFSFSCRDGSFFYGDLIAVSDSMLSVRSARHGEMTLKRAEVLNVRRINGPQTKLDYAGPQGDLGWTEPDIVQTGTPQSVTVERTGPCGAFLIPYYNRLACFEHRLPELVQLELRVSSSQLPKFRMLVAGINQSGFIIETYCDELVLSAGDQTRSICKLANDQREVTLRLSWDQISGQCTVYGEGTVAGLIVPATSGRYNAAAGEYFRVKNPFEKLSAGTGGISLYNKGKDLALELLRIKRWDGQPPAGIKRQSPYVELAGGSALPAEITGVAPGVIRYRSAKQTNFLETPIAGIDALVFSSDPPRLTAAGVSLSFADGTRLNGRLLSIHDGYANLQTAFAAEPVVADLKGLRQLRRLGRPGLDGARVAQDLSDALLLQGSTFHGKLLFARGPQPQWLAVGSHVPVTPAQGVPCKFTRAIPVRTDWSPPPALVYIKSGEAFPGILRDAGPDGVELESGLFGHTRFPSNQLCGIVLHAQPRALDHQQSGGWQVMSAGGVVSPLSKDEVALDSTTALWNPQIPQNGEVCFNVALPAVAEMHLRLFARGPNDPEAVTFELSRILDEQFWVTARWQKNAGDDGYESRYIRCDKPFETRLVLSDQAVELWVNGVHLHTHPLPAGQSSGAGLKIDSTSALSVAGLSVTGQRDVVSLPYVAAEAKLQTLVVPRFRKDLPPRHLLIGVNGDLLRGEIEAMSGGSFQFRSGLDSLRVPAARVRSALWLNPDDFHKLAAPLQTPVSEAPDVGAPTHWLELIKGGSFGLVVDGFTPECVSGHHPLLGRCTVPISELQAISNFQPPRSAVSKELAGWRLTSASEPALDDIGKPAAMFKLPLLNGQEFDLAAQNGRIIVLDFWATWCGPCINSLPALIKAVEAFPADRVQLVAINQDEEIDAVKRFLGRHDWKLTVALDAGCKVSAQYEVEAIPHTVVIGPDGKIAWSHTGASADAAREMSNVIKELLLKLPAQPADGPRDSVRANEEKQ